MKLELILILGLIPAFLFGQEFTSSTTITITKTWSQQPSGYTYPMDIYVPTSAAPADGYPVCITLHGNGGQGNVNAWRSTLPNHIIVAPSGYERSWNVADETSNAPDVEMVGELVDLLQTYSNINPNKIRVLGTSNGAALANRIFIENKDDGIDIICPIVTHLTTANYHNNGFYYPSGETGDNGTGTPPFEGYDTPTTPITGRRYLGISNTNDGVIPYYGGSSMVTGTTFLDARVSAHIIAQSQGFTGAQVMDSTLVDGTVYEFKYLDGQVVHLSGDALHGTNAAQKSYITTYFNSESNGGGSGGSKILAQDSDIIITKSWSQQPSGYTYPMDIYVPTGAVPDGGFPVCISLHGNGGQGNVNAWRNTLPNHIIVAPSGYMTSWNIAEENSDAPDVEMVSDLIDSLQTYSNVNPNKIRILGTSNGGSLANRVFIENKDAGLDIVCAFVSHLTTANYHNGGFYLPSGATGDNGTGTPPFEGYDTPTTPITGRRYLGISNTNDGLIPYYGGASPVGVTFLDARNAIYIVAQSQGYTGTQVMDSTLIDEVVYEFKYLDGQVVHLSGDALHGNNAVQRGYVTDYFNTELVLSSCIADRNLSTTVAAGTYQASNEITCNSAIADNGAVIFQAATITLTDGFSTGTNTTFTAQVAPCSAVTSNAAIERQTTTSPFKLDQLEIKKTKEPINIYPNPTTSIITIQGNFSTPVNYTLISPIGRIIKVGIISGGNAQIDLSDLPSSIYFLNVDTEVFKIYKR